ncbi:MAG: hypothetical protein ACLQVX_13735 [Limisphaerales bacterium]
MTEDPNKGAGKDARKSPPCFYLWLILVGATFLILLAVTQFLPGGRRSFSDWMQPVLFLAAVSLVVGTACLGVWLFGRWCRRGHNLKRALLSGACLAALAALFYAEEDWRGWHSWSRFKETWEARGEHFTLAEVVPPPVPDEQNFAMTPIAFSSYGQVLTRTGKLIPAEKRDEHFAIRMRMAPTPDSITPTNCVGDRVKGTFTRLEGWQDYYRDLAARTNAFPVPAQPRSAAEDVLAALSRYDGVIEELRAANRLPCSRFPLNYDSESPILIHLPHLAPLKGCAQVLQLRCLAELQNGQPDKALEDARFALQLTEKVRNEPILISHLVRIAMVQLMLQPIWEGLAQHKWSDAHLVALDAELAKLDFPSAWRLGMKGELGGQGDEIQLLRRQPGRCRELEGLTDLSGSRIDPGLACGLFVRLIPSGWFYQNQYRCARMMEDYYIPLADVSRGTFAPDLARRGDAVLAAETKGPFNVYSKLMLPSLGTAARRFAYGQASVDLARAAIALERCRLARGEFPVNLDSLAPQFIAKVPHDVIGGQPLRYRREPDGLFVLYSIGWNQTDDGGVAGFNENGSVEIQSGDWVWRYPANPK